MYTFRGIAYELVIVKNFVEMATPKNLRSILIKGYPNKGNPFIFPSFVKNLSQITKFNKYTNFVERNAHRQKCSY